LEVVGQSGLSEGGNDGKDGTDETNGMDGTAAPKAAKFQADFAIKMKVLSV
jgi:hypothetical protein